MTAPEYRAALQLLGLTQAKASALFGVSDRTSRRWAAGTQDIPNAVALSLRLMVSYSVPLTEAQVLARE